jgi:hypothetical protein
LLGDSLGRNWHGGLRERQIEKCERVGSDLIGRKEKRVRDEVPESVFVSAFVFMILANDTFNPGFIARRATNDPDANRTSYVQYAAICSSEKGLLRDLFSATGCAWQSFLSFRQCGQDLDTQNILGY